jgi:hypothetical protein
VGSIDWIFVYLIIGGFVAAGELLAEDFKTISELERFPINRLGVLVVLILIQCARAITWPLVVFRLLK